MNDDKDGKDKEDLMKKDVKDMAPEEREKALSDYQEDRIRREQKARRMKKRIRTAIIWILIIALVGTMVGIYHKKQEEQREKLAEMSKTVEVTEKVKETKYQVAIDISSFVEPYQIQEAKFRTGGAVTGVFVEEGDFVKKGDLLASIDNTNQVAQLSNIRNQIKEAEMTGNRRNLDQLKLQEKNAENALDYTNIYANFDGVVTSVNVAEGDYFDPGSKVLTVVDISKLKATVEVDEIDMQFVKEGMKAYLSFDSVPGRMIEGYVSYIPMLGHYSTSGIGVVDVEIIVPDPPKGVIPGFSFEGKIAVDDEVSMIIVPQAAVKTQRGGISTVTVRDANGFDEERAVTVKYLGENLVQIQSDNVAVGETIVYQKNRMQGGMGMMGMGGASRMMGF